MRSFNEFVNRLYSLTTKEAFKNDIEAFMEFYDSRTPKILNKEKGSISVYKVDTEHPYKGYIIDISYAGELLKEAKQFCHHPERIIKDLNGPELKESIHKWHDKLTITEKLSSKDAFLKNNFPEYFESLNILKEKLEEIILSLELDKGRRGRKSTLTIEEQVKIINTAESLLLEDPTEYRPRKGAYVSQRLKNKVNDDLSNTIPELSFYKVDRILFAHFHAKKN